MTVPRTPARDRPAARAGSVAILASVTALAFAAAARANGRFPTAQHVVLGADGHSRRVTFRVTFGLLVSDDGAQSFRWLCEEAMYGPTMAALTIDPSVEIDDRGRTLIAFGGGLRWWSPDQCGVTTVPGLVDRELADLAITSDRSTVYAIETTPGAPQWVLRASTADLGFARVGEGLSGVELGTIDVAPSDPRRIYVAGVTVGDRQPFVLRSDDAGQRFARIEIVPGILGDGAYLAGVDPADPGRLWVRTSLGLGSTLVRVRDGGRDVATVARSMDPMLGFARSGDGRTVWYGTVAEGLYRSDDGGGSFARVNDLAVYCLAFHEGVLWACGDWLRGAFALGRSTDGGARFDPVLRFDDIAGPVQCAGEGPAGCEPRWPMVRSTVVSSRVDAGFARRDAGSRDVVVLDAAADVRPPSSESSNRGCGCATSRAPRSCVAPAVAALSLWRCRRRSRSGSVGR